MATRFYCMEYDSKKLYVAAGSKKALNDFNSLYFRDNNLEVRVVEEAEASLAPGFSDFEKSRKLKRDHSFCLGVVKNNH